MSISQLFFSKRKNYVSINSSAFSVNTLEDIGEPFSNFCFQLLRCFDPQVLQRR